MREVGGHFRPDPEGQPTRSLRARIVGWIYMRLGRAWRPNRDQGDRHRDATRRTIEGDPGQQ